MIQWSSHYWNRVETGVKVKVGEFAFADASLNSPLFNPLRGARQTLVDLNVLPGSTCDGLASLSPGLGDSAVWETLKQAMKEWTFTTNGQTNPSGTSAHIALISSAPPETTWSSVGNDIHSTLLPCKAASGTNPTPTAAGTISTATQAAINKLINVGSIIASASAGTSEAQAIITGEESHATKFERGVQATLTDGAWLGTTWRVDAAFGVFGSMPLVGVTFDDCFVLMDAVNGNLDGPFANGSALDASALLAYHTMYQSGTPLGYYNIEGCKRVIASSKQKVPCPSPTPAGACLPTGFTPVTVPNKPPGNPGAWSCVFTPGTPNSACKCTTTYTNSSPAPCPGAGWNPPMDLPNTAGRCLVFEKWTCEGSGPNCGAAGCPSGVQPGASPPTNPISPNCAPTCTVEYWYWAQ